MSRLEELRQSLSDATKDMRLNLSNILSGEGLDDSQRWTIAICSALFLRAPEVAEALIADADNSVSASHVDDAKAAAAIMAMNTVYYRTKHMLGQPDYDNLRASLRMSRMAKPATSKIQFELCSMACASLAGCEACIQSHEASLVQEGLSKSQVHEAIRIAAALNGFVTGLAAESISS